MKKDKIYANDSDLVNKANELIGKKVSDVTNVDDYNPNDKGYVGKKVEDFLGIKNNSRKEVDFPNINTELKVSPLKKLKNGKFSQKESIKICVINYLDIKNESDFKKTKVYEKILKTLFISYLHKDDKRLAKFIKINLINFENSKYKNLIKEFSRDYEFVRNKIKNNEPISRADTSYLEVARSGQGGNEEHVKTQSYDSYRKAFMLKRWLVQKILEINNEKELTPKPNPKPDELKKEIENLILGKKIDLKNKATARLDIINELEKKYDINDLEDYYFIKIAGVNNKGELKDGGINSSTFNENEVKKDFYESKLYKWLSKKILLITYNYEKLIINRVVDITLSDEDIDSAKEVFDKFKYGWKNGFKEGNEKAIKLTYDNKKIFTPLLTRASENKSISIRPKDSKNKNGRYKGMTTNYGQTILRMSAFLTKKTINKYIK